MDEAAGAARARPAPTPAGATRSPSSSATTCSPGPPTSPPSSGPRRCGSRRARSPGWCTGRSPRRSGPRGADPIEHYLHVIAEKTGSLIATSARFGGMFGGADAGARRGAGRVRRDDRHRLPALRRPARHRLASRRSRARRPAPTCARASPRCRCSTRWPPTTPTPPSVRLREILAAGPVTDDALHAEALGLLRESPAMKRARETVRGYAERGPGRSWRRCPTSRPARALESLCDFIADRTS